MKARIDSAKYNKIVIADLNDNQRIAKDYGFIIEWALWIKSGREPLKVTQRGN